MFPGRTVPDADTRRALLLILAILERHSRALRGLLLTRASGPEPAGVLGDLLRREHALREAARQLQALAAREATRARRRRRTNLDPTRQGVLPLLEPTTATRGSAPYPQRCGAMGGKAGDEPSRGRVAEPGRTRK